jgi:hypothetical protein
MEKVIKRLKEMLCTDRSGYTPEEKLSHENEVLALIIQIAEKVKGKKK